MSDQLIPNGPQILCRRCGAVCNNVRGLCADCYAPEPPTIPKRCNVACDWRPDHGCELRVGHPGSHMHREMEWYNAAE